MKVYLVLLLVLVCRVNRGETAKSYQDIRNQIARNPRLRNEVLDRIAGLIAKVAISDNIDVRATLSSTAEYFKNFRLFGLETSTLDVVQLFFRAFLLAPEPESIELNKFTLSNGHTNVILAILRALRKAMFNQKVMEKLDSSLIVNTTEGRLQGVHVEENGVKYIAYYDIPYGTMGTRFLALRPPKPWQGVRYAGREGRICPQKLQYFGQIGGAEDCLHLNVNLPKPIKTGLPVVVMIHGGGFNFGTGDKFFFSPERLVQQNLIVVTFNYRLGALGYLSTGTKDAPGNAGMKDMVAVLRWVKANIKNFGGDPGKVTVYGVSSGGIAAEYLILSPMAKGLFSGAIISSGSVFMDWAYASDPLKYTFRLSRQMGFPTTHVKDIIKFLRKANPLQIIEAQDKLSVDDNPSGEAMPFVPCVEPVIPGVEPFLTDHPENIMRSGKYNDVPIIFMFSDQEGLQVTIKAKGDKNYISAIDRNLEYYLPPDLLSGLDKPEEKEEILRRIRQFYFRGRKIGNETLQEAVDFLSDAKFLSGVYKSIKMRLETSRMPTYYGEFAFEGDLNYYKYYNELGTKGAAHADDLGYVFTLPFEKIYSENNATTQLVARRLIKMYTNFASSRNPTPTITNLLPVPWYPVRSTDTYDYLRITDKLQMKQNPNSERRLFWEQLYGYKRLLLLKRLNK